MSQLSIRFAPWWPVMFWAVGALNLVTFSMTGSTMQLVLAALFGVLGLLHMVGTPIVIDDNEVQLKNGFGMVMKRYLFQSLADLELEGNKLFVTTEGGERKKVATLGFQLNGSDKERLREALRTARSS